jgi:hypothetical protein
VLGLWSIVSLDGASPPGDFDRWWFAAIAPVVLAFALSTAALRARRSGWTAGISAFYLTGIVFALVISPYF